MIDVCDSHKKHIIRAADTREDYKLDAKSCLVLCLVFTKRIIAYNEIFAPFGDRGGGVGGWGGGGGGWGEVESAGGVDHIENIPLQLGTTSKYTFSQRTCV